MHELYIPKRNMFGLPDRNAGIYVDGDMLHFEKCSLQNYLTFYISVPQYISVDCLISEIKGIAHYGKFEASFFNGVTQANSILFLDRDKKLLALIALAHNEFSESDVIKLLHTVLQRNGQIVLAEMLQQVLTENSFAPITRQKLSMAFRSIGKMVLILGVLIGAVVLIGYIRIWSGMT